MARLDTLLTDTRPGMGAAPDAVIMKALRRASMEFFRQSQVWQEQLDDQQTQAGVDVYDLDPPSGSRVERVLWVKYDGRLLKYQARERELTAQTASSSDPRAWATPNSEQVLRVWPAPDKVGTLSVFVVLVPTRDVNDIPDALLDEYQPGLIALAKADMMGNTPGMPYHDPAEASVQYNFGKDWIVRAKRKQMSGGWAPLRVQPRPFA